MSLFDKEGFVGEGTEIGLPCRVAQRAEEAVTLKVDTIFGPRGIGPGDWLVETPIGNLKVENADYERMFPAKKKSYKKKKKEDAHE